MTGVPPNPPSPPGGRPSEVQQGGVHLLRDLPLQQSILWHPSSPTVVQRRPPSGPYPVFIDQKAITAVHHHFETAGRQGMMGFLVGDLFESPDTHLRYVIVDSTIRLNQAVYGDKTFVIVSRLWDRIQEELKKTEGHLIGWYHSHPPITVELAPGDVETHLYYFKRPWHVALVLATEHEGPVAGLFRPKPGETAKSTSLPFYELIEADEGVALERKQSVLPWINFLTDDAAVQYPDASAPQPPTPAASSSTLQVVRPVRPTPKPAPAVATSPSGKVAAVKPPQPPPAAPAAPAPVAAAAPPPKPQQPGVTGTVARPALADRPQPAPASPASPAAPPAPSGPGRRDTQMKSPPNALSNLPLVAAGGYELGEVDTRASEPGVMRPKQRETLPVPPVPVRRQSALRPAGSPAGRPMTTPRAFAPALAQRRSDGHPGLVAALVLALVGGGAFAGWWYFVRPQTAATPAATAAAQAPGPDTTKHVGVSSPETDNRQPTTANRPPTTPAAAVDSPLVQLDRNADSVSALVRTYDARVTANQVECPGLSQALVSVEDGWMRYNIGKKKTPNLDGDRFTRDAKLYASVDSVERHFDKSGCSRP